MIKINSYKPDPKQVAEGIQELLSGNIKERKHEVPDLSQYYQEKDEVTSGQISNRYEIKGQSKDYLLLIMGDLPYQAPLLLPPLNSVQVTGNALTMTLHKKNESHIQYFLDDEQEIYLRAKTTPTTRGFAQSGKFTGHPSGNIERMKSLIEEDFKYFHQTLKPEVRPYLAAAYENLKKAHENRPNMLQLIDVLKA